MTCRTLGVASLLLLAPALLAAQGGDSTRESASPLLLEHRFTDSAGQVVVALERDVVYRARVTGPGTPAFQDSRRGGQSAFVVPVARGGDEQSRWFAVYPYETGAHTVRLSDLPPGATATLRVSRDVAETRRVRAKNEHLFAFGVLLGAGVHSGYRIDPNAGADPKGGTDWEACLLAEVADRVGACFGFGEQSFPGADFGVHWWFVEARGRIVSANVLGAYRTDLYAALRHSETEGVGTQNVNPELLSYGLYVTQHLSPGSRGWSLYGSWEHGRLGHTSETEKINTDRFMAGAAWLW